MATKLLYFVGFFLVSFITGLASCVPSVFDSFLELSSMMTFFASVILFCILANKLDEIP
jgi:hypothetical protein